MFRRFLTFFLFDFLFPSRFNNHVLIRSVSGKGRKIFFFVIGSFLSGLILDDLLCDLESSFHILLREILYICLLFLFFRSASGLILFLAAFHPFQPILIDNVMRAVQVHAVVEIDILLRFIQRFVVLFIVGNYFFFQTLISAEIQFIVRVGLPKHLIHQLNIRSFITHRLDRFLVFFQLGFFPDVFILRHRLLIFCLIIMESSEHRTSLFKIDLRNYTILYPELFIRF